MAFTYTILDKTVFGNKRVVFGLYSNDAGSTGGTIESELDSVISVKFTPIGTTNANFAIINTSTTPYSPDVDLVCEANGQGLFEIIGL